MTATNFALVLVDLQNEFLTPQGNFPIKDPDSLISNIANLIAHIRAIQSPILWIRATYDAPQRPARTPVLINPLDGTHMGNKPCCVDGTPGAEFPPAVSALLKPNEDLVVTKRWYSAFKETELEELLRMLGVTNVCVAGLLTNVCVLSTVVAAKRLGFKVHVVEECLGYVRKPSHEKALRTMQDLGVDVVATAASLSTPRIQPLPPQPTLYYVNGSIPSWRVMMALYEKGVDFQAVRRRVMSTPKETREPDFLALNHRGKTPVFVDPLPAAPDGSSREPILVNESLAILHYIETYYKPENPLLPPADDRAGRAFVLARLQESENLHHTYDALEESHFGKGFFEGQLADEDRIALMDDVYVELDYWEVYASLTPFIAGDAFTLADCAFFPLLAYMVHRGFKWERPTYVDVQMVGFVQDAWINLRKYFERVWERGGEDGCAQRAQPEGWENPGRANVWKLTGLRKT